MVWPRDVTALLDDWSRDNRTALSQLLPFVYAELRRVAVRPLQKEQADHTLQARASSKRCASGSSTNARSIGENRAPFFGFAAATAKRDWRTATAWLNRELGSEVRP